MNKNNDYKEKKFQRIASWEERIKDDSGFKPNNDTNVQEVQNYELHLAFTVENKVVILIRNA